jgi:hypothetical protein
MKFQNWELITIVHCFLEMTLAAQYHPAFTQQHSPSSINPASKTRFQLSVFTLTFWAPRLATQKKHVKNKEDLKPTISACNHLQHMELWITCLSCGCSVQAPHITFREGYARAGQPGTC